MTTFDFMGKRKVAAVVSIALVVVSIGSVISSASTGVSTSRAGSASRWASNRP